MGQADSMTVPIILAIDPGPTKSAWVYYESSTGEVRQHDKEDNDKVLLTVQQHAVYFGGKILVIEQIAAMGMAVGAEVFETCVWSGRFIQAWQPGPWARVKRHEVKMHLCGSMRAKDGNIRQALIDRYGGKDKAIGKKARPGPLFGIAGDCWAALAVAVTYAESLKPKNGAGR